MCHSSEAVRSLHSHGYNRDLSCFLGVVDAYFTKVQKVGTQNVHILKVILRQMGFNSLSVYEYESLIIGLIILQDDLFQKRSQGLAGQECVG